VIPFCEEKNFLQVIFRELKYFSITVAGATVSETVRKPTDNGRLR